MPQKVYLELTEAQFDVLNDCLQSAVTSSSGVDFDWTTRQEEIASTLADDFRSRSVVHKIRGTLIDLTETEARAIMVAVRNSTCCPDFVKDFLTSAERKAVTRAQLEIEAAAQHQPRIAQE